MDASLHAFRGAVAHCLDDPDADRAAWQYFADGLLLVAAGRVVEVGAYAELSAKLSADTPIEDYTGKLIVPGFVDSHIHYPQVDVIASYGEQLLQWLEKYTFPHERRFDDLAYARETAEFFLDELIRNGTTTALVLATVHPTSAEAVFAAAEARRLRLIAGKVLMDRNCPADLRDDAESGYRDSKALIERWHRRERLLYAITPRFAPTSSDAQLARAGQLAAEHPDVYIHSHVAENRDEVAWVARLFPQARSYLDVYERYGLLRDRCVLAHGIYLDHDDRLRMARTGAAAAFCPSANLFLGSGLFDLAAARALGVRVGLGSDVGGGTSFSLLRNLRDAYHVVQLRGQTLSPRQALYQITLGGARALYLDDKIGNFTAGKEADFVVLDPRATPLLARRSAHCHDVDELWFALMMLGDDRTVAATYVLGREAKKRGIEVNDEHEME